MRTNKLLFLLLITIFIFSNAIAQKISLNELQTFCTNKNWETTNKTLLAQKWDFYNSKKGDDEGYNVIEWVHGRSLIDDNKAKSWLNLYSFEGLPNKVIYRFREKEYYNVIQNQLVTNAFKLSTENILDGRVIANYENATYYLQLAYTREEDSTNEYLDSAAKTYTAYEVVVYKKGGIYDPNNGLKKEYDEAGKLVFEYNIKQGVLEGEAKTYYSDGKLEKKLNYKNDKLNGSSEHYFYQDDMTADFFLLITGNYSDGNKEGLFKTVAIYSSEDKVVELTNYKNNQKNGKSFNAVANKITVQNYKNDQLNGNYIEYVDLNKKSADGLTTIDTLNLPKTSSANLYYENNLLSGGAKYFDSKGSLLSEGFYKDSMKTGTWKQYYKNDYEGNKPEYAGKLYLIENYIAGKLNGKSEQFSLLEKMKIPCDKATEKDCFKEDISYFQVISNFTNDKLEGEFSFKAQDGSVLQQGHYSNGLKLGKWIEFGESEFSTHAVKARSYQTGNYVDNKKEGQWERLEEEGSRLESYTYYKDIIHGKHQIFLNGETIRNNYFESGELYKIEDLKEEKIIKSCEIKDVNATTFKLIEINYTDKFIKQESLKVVAANTDFKISPRTFSLDFEKLDESKKLKDGLFELKTKDGKIVSTGNYVHNAKQGEWNDFYYDQEVKTTFQYKNGLVEDEYYYDLKKNEPFSGEFIFSDLQNNATEERKIKNGERHGTTRYKDQKDKTIKKESYKEGILKE